MEKESIKKTRFSASMYNCPYNDNCYQTYGFIVNNSNGYIRCSLEGCFYYKISSLQNNCVDSGIGNLINDSGEIKLCINIKQSISLSSTDEKTYFVNINMDNSYPETLNGQEILINVGHGMSYIIIDESYVLIDNMDRIIKNRIEKSNHNKLYKCNGQSKSCELVNSPEEGYYYSYLINNENKYIIECRNGCISSENKYELSFVKGQYLYWKEISNSNQKIFPGNEKYNILSISEDLSIKKYVGKNFILINRRSILASDDELESSSDLYQCNELLGNCNKVDNIYDGWYVSGDSNYKAIKCSNKECSVQRELSNSCINDGDFIYYDNNYYICVESKKYKLREISGNSLYLDSKNISFPNKMNYLIGYSNYIIGIGRINNDKNINRLSTCKTTDSKSKCIDINNKDILEREYCLKSNKIYMTKSNKCIEQFNTETSVHLFYRNNEITKENYKIYKYELESLPNGIQLYYCNNGNCRVTTGYYKIENNNICRCEYTGCKLLKYSDQGNQSGDITLISTGKLKYGKDVNHVIGSMIKGSYYYIEGKNNFPGSENLKSFLVEAGDNYYIVFSGDGYYLINSSNNMEKTDPEKNEIINNRKRQNVILDGVFLKKINSNSTRDINYSRIEKDNLMNRLDKTILL